MRQNGTDAKAETIIPMGLEAQVKYWLLSEPGLLVLHRDPIKMHPFSSGLYFRNYLIEMKKYFIITISGVLSFICEILSKIRRGVLQKSRIL